MEYYIDLIANKKWIFYIISFSFIILIVYTSIVIDERFGGLLYYKDLSYILASGIIYGIILFNN